MQQIIRVLTFDNLHREYTQVVDSLPQVKRAGSPKEDTLGGGLARGFLEGKAGGGGGGLLGGNTFQTQKFCI